MIDWNIILNGANRFLTGNSLNLNWQVQEMKQQNDIKYERIQSRLCYVEDEDYDLRMQLPVLPKLLKNQCTLGCCKTAIF